VQRKEPLGVSIRKTKDTKEGGQKGLFLVFPRPQLAQAFGSPEPSNNIMVKKLARLGELLTSRLRFNSPG